MARIRLLLLAAALAAPASAAQLELVPEGAEFQVNSHTPGDVGYPSLSTSGDGTTLVLWLSDEPPSRGLLPGLGVVARPLASTGVPLASDLRIDGESASVQGIPAVAADDQGFLVVWEGTLTRGASSRAVLARRVGVDGQALATPFEVTGAEPVANRYPAVTGRPDGGFVVAWTAIDPAPAKGSTDTDLLLRARAFDSTATPLGVEFRIDAGAERYPIETELVARAGGDFVVAWLGLYDCAYDCSVVRRAARFDASGSRLGTELELERYNTIAGFWTPTQLADPQGEQAAALWVGDSFAIRARRVPWEGPLAEPATPLSDGTVRGSDPALAVAPGNGSSMLVFSSPASPGSDPDGSVVARAVGRDLEPLGAIFQVNTYTTNFQASPSVTVLPDDAFLVLWRSKGSLGDDTDGSSVQARRFVSLRIFDDGFESGDSERWTLVVPGGA